jgi:hypothetical protein
MYIVKQKNNNVAKILLTKFIKYSFILLKYFLNLFNWTNYELDILYLGRPYYLGMFNTNILFSKMLNFLHFFFK